ncbi:hypothetical protein EVA_03935 [gut metagenome]|uniref:Uncharacterized protein n=1 Tax=gut metagenome TaxID=749906 RepID=J9GJR2_9ZZZZ
MKTADTKSTTATSNRICTNVVLPYRKPVFTSGEKYNSSHRVKAPQKKHIFIVAIARPLFPITTIFVQQFGLEDVCSSSICQFDDRLHPTEISHPLVFIFQKIRGYQNIHRFPDIFRPKVLHHPHYGQGVFLVVFQRASYRIIVAENLAGKRRGQHDLLTVQQFRL